MRDTLARQACDDPSSPGSGARWDVWPVIPQGARRLLDVGCGAGSGFAGLRQRGLTVVGGDVNPEFVSRAREILDEAQLIDLEEGEWPTGWRNSFDVVVFADVLEHLVDPWRCLNRVRHLLTPKGCVVASIPNVRQWRILAKLAVLGTWDYRIGAGTLQREHVRFFTRRTIRLMFNECNYRVEFLWPRPTFHLRPMDAVLDTLTLHRVPDLLFGSYTVRAWPRDEHTQNRSTVTLASTNSCR